MAQSETSGAAAKSPANGEKIGGRHRRGWPPPSKCNSDGGNADALYLAGAVRQPRQDHAAALISIKATDFDQGSRNLADRRPS